MVEGAAAMGPAITVGDDARITQVGRFLREWKLDEIPQLFNVLIGTMSLVGPRPEVPHYVGKYDRMQRRVLSLKPGVTDPASIEFRHEQEVLAKSASPDDFYVRVLMPRKVEINLKYAEQATVVSDLVVVFRTLRVLFP